MTDNEKMREAVAAATKIVKNPHGYTETSVLVASALLEQAAKSVPECDHLWKAGLMAKGGHPVEGPFVAVCSKCGAAPSLSNDDRAWQAAELERLRKDAERLDWLDNNTTRVSDSERYLPRHVYWGKGTKHTVRTAIDAAIAGEKK